MTTAWRDLALIHRLEFPLPVNYVCYASLGACFAAGGVQPLGDVSVLAAIVSNLSLIVAPQALNTAADVSTDERHPERGRLTSAVRRFGRDRIVRCAAAELAGAVLLAGLVSVWSGRPLIVAAAVLTIALQVLYNTEPVRLKRRGLTGVTAFCAATVLLPFLLSYWAVRPDVDTAAWLVVAGLWMLAAGRMTAWSIPDRAADAATGMQTPPVRYGMAGAVALCAALLAAGLVLTGWGLWGRYGPWWALPLVAMQATFLGGAVGLLRRPGEAARVSKAHILRRMTPPVTIGTVALSVTPLVAGLDRPP
ncbi:MAG TPA: UbiA family prenyltransferase [Actinophytocola sp.]|uniref:UbiA prenyltransferase family protein n=1 Tax=Actinophytocola sp. TaxID=1872138 RepID=UPI002DDD9CAC|nr:UbiA family prenyltransferase [Actinophytocola sp.]HEV2778249.1 UbiA family prenyltransferase [Actinophytocola sp.]